MEESIPMSSSALPLRSIAVPHFSAASAPMPHADYA
jgi:hypothetical protein